MVGWTDELPEDARDLERVVSPVPAFDADGLALLRWVADRYAGTLSDVLRLAVPPRVAAVERDTDPAGAPATAEAEPGGTASAAEAPAPSGARDRLVEMVGRGRAGRQGGRRRRRRAAHAPGGWRWGGGGGRGRRTGARCQGRTGRRG